MNGQPPCCAKHISNQITRYILLIQVHRGDGNCTNSAAKSKRGLKLIVELLLCLMKELKQIEYGLELGWRGFVFFASNEPFIFRSHSYLTSSGLNRWRSKTKQSWLTTLWSFYLFRDIVMFIWSSRKKAKYEYKTVSKYSDFLELLWGRSRILNFKFKEVGIFPKYLYGIVVSSWFYRNNIYVSS